MRIAKFIASCGVCSRRQAERLIEEGRVSVNGKLIDGPALNVSSDSAVLVDGKKINLILKTRVWLYNKPAGLVTTHSDEKGRRTVFDELKDKLPRVISVGRLDLNSEGLLILTNSGDFANKLELPSNKIERVYKVRAHSNHSKQLDIKNKKLIIDGVRYNPKEIKFLSEKGSNAWYRVVLSEGKNREIRKIFEHFGFEVNRLIRVSFGKYELGNIKSGEFKEVFDINL